MNCGNTKCGKAIEQGSFGRKRKYCDNACKQSAYRQRKEATSL